VAFFIAIWKGDRVKLPVGKDLIMNGSMTVADDIVVSLDYTLRLDDGQVVDTSTRAEPLEFLQGRGQIIHGLEQELYGMHVGEEKEVVVDPAEGYGDFDPNAFQLIPLDAFPPDVELEPGMGIELMSESGEPFVALVSKIGPEGVTLDFNHPLAGETLYFTIKIADLRQPTSEEMVHGHVHSQNAHRG
jgi:FKBP-type peptidyl-prolyl cis-trans isomerase SlyD